MNFSRPTNSSDLPARVLRRAILGAVAFALLGLTASCQAQQAAPGAPASAIHDGDRIVFVGDSITGQGQNAGQGWAHLLDETLRQSHAANPPTLVSLGGNGQGVGSWRDVEKRSREENFKLDVPDVNVKETLNKSADVLVIMLGMNDVLSPNLHETPADFDAWATDYRALIAALRARVHPRVLGLATIPLCTEDPDSPKNRVIAQLNERLIQVAKTEDGLLLPTNASLWQMLGNGRELRPDFHVTQDFVHPNEAGHIAIARGMQQGLGEPTTLLQTKYLAPLWKNSAPALPALSYTLETVPGALDAPTQTYQINYRWTTALPGEDTAAPASAPTVSLKLPAGWSATPQKLTARAGSFTVSGTPDRAHNLLSLEATAGQNTRKTAIDIPARWLLGTANVHQIGWSADSSSFDAAKSHLPADDALVAGQGWGQPLQLAPDAPLQWALWTPSVNYLGGDRAGNVDFAAVRFFQVFEVGYGTRWIYSSRPRRVGLKLGTQAASDNSHLSLWMNGQSLFAGHVGANQGKVVDAQLNQGWNQLVFKSNHLRWQWQFSIDLVETPEDDLSDLRFATVAPQ